MASTSIYILRLENGKYYVGKSDNPYKRYQEHLEGRGSAWTRQNRPVEVVRFIQGASSFDEDKYTKEYMARYGVENVRGGSYSSVRLDGIQKEALERELRGAQDACMRCGRPGHFARDCYARTEIKQVAQESTSKSTVKCYRCERVGHDASQCYARTFADGESIDEDCDDDDDEDEDDDEDGDDDDGYDSD
jgi:predicted GIY-YIG superfamily endonuclease